MNVLVIDAKGWLDYRTEDVHRILKVFKNGRLGVEFMADTKQLKIEYEVDVPKKLVVFLGVVVDLTDGTVYASHIPNIGAVKLGNINSLMTHIMGNPVGRETALLGIEKFKLTGNLKKMYEVMMENAEGSMISRSVNKVMSSSDSDRNERLNQFMKDFSDFYEALREFIGRAKREGSPENIAVINRNFSAFTVYGADYGSNGKGLDYDALQMSCASYWVGGETNYSDRSKQELLASNTVELCDAMEGAEDFVFSSDIKSRVRELGFDKILTGRELSSVTSNPAAYEVMREQVVSSADLNRTRYMYGKERFNYQDVLSRNSVIVRNSIKMLSKIITRIVEVKEGK